MKQFSETIFSDGPDGGPAFPHTASEPAPGGGINLVTKPGTVTLRDYFAAAAMQGLLHLAAVDDVNDWSKDAALSYVIADAMLTERAKLALRP